MAMEIVRAASMIADPSGLVLTNFLLLRKKTAAEMTIALLQLAILSWMILDNSINRIIL